MILDSPEKINLNGTQSGKRQILYVEDDRNSQFLVEQILRKDYDIDIAPHAKDVMMWVNMKAYDLILMDIKLDDGFSGVDLTRQIRKIPSYKEVPILAVTAIAFTEQLNFFVEQGCTDVITKPIDFKLFRSKVSDMVVQTQKQNRPPMYY